MGKHDLYSRNKLQQKKTVYYLLKSETEFIVLNNILTLLLDFHQTSY